jgi:hypothetical protein
VICPTYTYQVDPRLALRVGLARNVAASLGAACWSDRMSMGLGSAGMVACGVARDLEQPALLLLEGMHHRINDPL